MPDNSMEVRMSKILFIGDLNEYGRGCLRYRTLKEMGHEVLAHTHTKVSSPNHIASPSFLYRVFWKLRTPLDETRVNHKIINSLLTDKFEIIWIEKGNMIKPWTLRHVKRLMPHVKLISCSEDDMYAPHGHSLWYRLGLKYYDTVFTTKTYNLSELQLFRAQRTVLFFDSYDENIHKPMQLSAKESERFSCDVSAIGAFEPERAESLLFLAENGVQVTIWGNGWGNWVNRHKNLVVKNEFLFGSDYARTISASRINLNFLRKVNRDLITSRSIEIPACGGFMLGERTVRHLEFFKEGQEAEFFDSNEELLAKTRYYLEHSDERIKIAQAGRSRCLKSGYSMREQLKEIIKSA